MTNSYNATAEAVLKKEQDIRGEIANGEPVPVLDRLDLVGEILDLAVNYLTIHDASQPVQNLKNEKARKLVYRAVTCMEEIVSKIIDAPFTDYEEQLAAIEELSCAQRYDLAQKMDIALQSLKNAFENNAKWKWALVETEGRLAAVVKNMIDLRNVIADTDPYSPNYEPAVFHVRLAKKLLMQAADSYRKKYELCTNHTDDFKMGIVFLSALKRLNTFTGDQSEAVEVKKQLDTWTRKLVTDINKQAQSRYTKG